MSFKFAIPLTKKLLRLDSGRFGAPPLTRRKRAPLVSLLGSLLGFLLFLAILDSRSLEAMTEPHPPRTTVFWLSVDGFRPDYIHPSRTPFLCGWTQTQAFSLEVGPVVPSLTFPTHVSQATGVTVDQHGVPGNAFYDPQSETVFHSPHQARLLQAEPIWTTAARQGVPVLVYDWPLSHDQEIEPRTKYFGDRYHKDLSDQERLDKLLSTWGQDDSLQLVMGYIEGTDNEGHKFGPDSPEVLSKASEVDRQLEETISRVEELWQRSKREGDTLVVILSTDHGMERVHTGVNPEQLFQMTEREDSLVTSGNVANRFLPEAGFEEIQVEVERLRAFPFLKAYSKEELPRHWGYGHRDRVGEIVVFLRPGYTFSRNSEELLVRADKDFDPLGMHGYLPEDSSSMLGFVLLARYPEPFPRQDLGPLNALGFHRTVARLLGIEPSAESNPNLFPIFEIEP